jgi:hypothetical protein
MRNRPVGLFPPAEEKGGEGGPGMREAQSKKTTEQSGERPKA